jgi:hypothetical protein
MRSFKVDEKLITRNSSEWCGYFVFLTDQPIVSRTSFFGEAEAPFLHQLNTLRTDDADLRF